jgi:hypothetical protein
MSLLPFLNQVLSSINGRNAIDNALAHLAKATSGHAWFIVGAPHQKERDWWQKQLGGTVVLLNPGIQVCRQRAIDRGTPLALQGMTSGTPRVRGTGTHLVLPIYTHMGTPVGTP